MVYFSLPKGSGGQRPSWECPKRSQCITFHGSSNNEHSILMSKVFSGVDSRAMLRSRCAATLFLTLFPMSSEGFCSLLGVCWLCYSLWQLIAPIISSWLGVFENEKFLKTPPGGPTYTVLNNLGLLISSPCTPAGVWRTFEFNPPPPPLPPSLEDCLEG